MFENAKWITSKEDLGASPRFFFCDLDIIYPLRRATLTITAGGVYEAFVGSEKVGNEKLAPGWTCYDGHHLYQQYDITSLVAESNYLTVRVGSGWYCGRILRNTRPAPLAFALMAQVVLEFAGGFKKTVVTDEKWLCGASDVVMSDIYDGEIFDARIKPAPTENAVVIEGDKFQLFPQNHEPIREVATLSPKEVFTTPEGDTVVDFGENLAGYPFFEDITAKSGETVELSFAEVMDKNGNFYNKNYRSAKCIFKYICRDGVQSYRPFHTFYGFRCVRVDSLPEGMSPWQLRAARLSSDLERTGSFECGVPEINKLYANVIRGQQSNFLDVPTDCPQRDERLGWTGDAEVFCRTAAYNFNVKKFFDKWLYDMKLDQMPDGRVTKVVPNVLGEYKGSATIWGEESGGEAAWSDAVTIVPWTMFLMYGDALSLDAMLPAMEKWVGYLRSFGDNEFAVGKRHQYGDWLALDNPVEGDCGGGTPVSLVADAYYAYSCELTCKALETLGLDSGAYRKLHENIVKEYRRNHPDYPTQTACVLALKFRLCPEEERENVAKRLADMIHEAGDSLKTGFVGTAYLVETLAENGYADLAYTLLLRKEYPSWLYSVSKGATTIWEHWDGIKEDGSMWSDSMNSYNHYAYGAVAQWFYEGICGIKPSELGGFAEFTLSPLPDKRLGYAKAEFKTKFGFIRSSWRYEGENVRYRFGIPEGTVATLTLPGKEPTVLTGGEYEF